MNSEKVKEIKKCLVFCKDRLCEVCPRLKQEPNQEEDCRCALIEQSLTLINELESENERLKWEKQTLEDKDTLLAKVGEMVQENQQLKDRIAELESELEKEQINNLNCDTELQYKEKRIAELEKENETKTDTIAELLKKQEIYEKEKLTKFAERLKEKLFDLGNIVNKKDIDETLKEFINKGDEER